MPRFNFNEITKSGKADIDKIGENFAEIENNALASSDIVDNLTTNDATKVLSAKQGKLLNDTKTDKANFALLTNPSYDNINGVQYFNYPEGFTAENSMIVSVAGYHGDSSYYGLGGWYYFNVDANSFSLTPVTNVVMTADKITFNYNNYSNEHGIVSYTNVKMLLVKL